MVSEPDTGRCASLFAVPRRGGVNTRRCASKNAGFQWGVDLGAVLHRLEEGNSTSEGLERGGGVDYDVPH